ncbi:hypothetical protein [Tomitella cavernea]|uniref:Uncharacterized protein n=1 Tax=Tomitella cavernea TaxID=1387982 RepID=A0ABP9CF31_9ACTN
MGPSPAAGASAAQDAPGGAGRRTMGPAMLGGGGRGRGGDEGHDAAGFLTTVGHGDQLIGDLGTVVHPVLGSADGA